MANKVTIKQETWKDEPFYVVLQDMEGAPKHHPKFSVIMARYEGKWLFCRHKDRATWEIPGGHIEEGESPLEAAKRELNEETGAEDFDIMPVAVYNTEYQDKKSYGRLFLAEVSRLGDLPNMEIAEVQSFDALPDAMTYPTIQPHLFERVMEYIAVSEVQD